MDEPTQTTANPPPTAPPPVGPDLSGRTLDDFVLLRRLGQGGMGQVYLAEQRSLKRKVALKILRPDLAANAESLRRFKLEAEAVARATHANIVQVHAVGECDGLPYMALEYVEGRNLREFVARKGPPELPVALSLMRQVAAALARAGELGIVHRDIKPDNILLTRKGEAKVADFGLSRCLDGGATLHLTQSGVTMGTPLYMSPEQVEGRPVDCRTDVYSFGATCYYMLAGRPPFHGGTAFEVALQHVRAEPPPLGGVRPDLPPPLCALVHRMLAKDPATRPQTGRELLKEVARLRETLGGASGAVTRADLTAESTPPGGRTAVAAPAAAATAVPAREVSAPRGRRRLVAALFVLSLALAASAGVGLSRLHRPADAAVAAGGPPADPDVEALLAAQSDEKALRRTVELLLQSGDRRQQVGTGMALCTRLGLLYLDQGRLEEAEQFFKRLDGIKDLYPYHVLGRLGRAVVAALQDRKDESNDLFKRLADELYFDGLFRGAAGKSAEARRVNPEVQKLWRNPRVLFWVSQALRYNAANGVKDADVPPALLKLRDAHAGEGK